MIAIWNKSKTKVLFFKSHEEAIVAFEKWRAKKLSESKKSK